MASTSEAGTWGELTDRLATLSFSGRTADHVRSRGPKPGERVLDGQLVRWSNGQTVSVNELTRTTAWTLLLFGGTHRAQNIVELVSIADRATANRSGRIQAFHVVAANKPAAEHPASDAVLMDPYHLLHEKYRVTPPTLYLLRPDCVVGFRGRLAAAEQLFGYLGRVFS